MRSAFVSRILLASVVALGAVGCSGSAPTPEPENANNWRTLGGMFLHGQLRAGPGQSDLRRESAPPGAHLLYFGGRIVSNAQVVQVIYGTGDYIPQVTSTASPSMATFYQGVLNSAYVDWLTEYNTVGLPPPTSSQILGRGSFSTQVTITPAPENNGTVIDDSQIQAELSAQIAAGNIPAPTADSAGNNNTYYAIFFPHGKTITLGGAASCQVFCAYHGTIADAGGAGEVYYGVHPDFQPGSGCEFGCGAAQTQFGNYTQVASHELIEVITDPEVGIATVFGPPLAWIDPVFSEIGDICNGQNGQVLGGDGVTYDVQTEFSNSVNDCIVTNPLITPMTIDANEQTCRGTTATATVTLFGGAGRFTSDVTLSLLDVNPTPPAGGEITATFDPNPVPTPADNGSTSTMRIATTGSTPPGTYTLTVQAASTALTATTTTTLVVFSDVPGVPTLLTPPNGADGVSATPTFTWSPVSQASSYTLDVFAGNDCVAPPIRTFDTSNTSFTVQPADALPKFQAFSWQVSAANSCGGGTGTSACFNFRTESCSAPHDLTNGGFENGLDGWTVDLAVPPPVVDGQNPHSGANAVLLGNLTGPPEPLGDAQVSRIVTLPASGPSTLVFWEWPLTTDSVTFDQQYVLVTPINPPGAAVTLMFEARNDQTYIRREFDMSQFAGMTVRLTFGVHQDGFGDVTAMFVDDVSLGVITCGPPDFAIRVTPSASDEVCAGNSLTFVVAVDSVNGPNFTSPVTLSATNLPPGATATFAQNPIGPGESTIMTLQTTRPTIGKLYTFNVSGLAVTPPPDGPRVTPVPVLIDANPPSAPELVSPRNGDVNVPRRPTLSWTAPFVPDSAVASATKGSGMLGSGASASKRAPYLWEMAANRPPNALKQDKQPTGNAAGGAARSTQQASLPPPFFFGASAYHVQVARDAAFTNIVVDAQVATTSFTVPIDLDIATEYFWRVSATNACGTSAFSSTGTFIVGACFEDWAAATPIPITEGPSQSTVIAANNKLYVIGGGIGPGPNLRIDQTWAYDPQNGSWTRKTDVPAPGIGANFGSGVELGGKIYLFGGVNGPPGPIVVHRALWRYDIAADSWSRGADLPTDNFGAAVAAIDGKIYIAYGSGFVTQTWQYDPVADTYTRKADAPNVPTPLRLHGVALNGELHAFAGGFEGNAHTIYNPATNTWRVGPNMPFTATDPAAGVLGGQAYVIGGRPVAHTQIFDPVTETWSQGAPIAGAVPGVDNTAGAVLGLTFHVVGGYNGTTGVNTHWQLHVCNAGGLSSATFFPFVVDGNGTVTGIGNERTSLLIDNALSGTTLSVSCFLYGANGSLLGNDTFTVAPNELKSVTDVVRALSHSTGVQNQIGSVAVFGTDVFQGMASMVNNQSTDPALEDGQSIAGRTSGFVSTIESQTHLTQTVFANVSSTTALVQLVAYPPGGGDIPASATVAVVPPHGLVSYPDTVRKLGLPTGFSGQLSWSSSQPIGAMARNVTRNRQYSGIEPVLSLADTSSTIMVPYVEDTAAFSTALEISNPGPITANVTVSFVDVEDQTGGSSGVESSRDIPVPVNYGTPIADIVRWVQRSGGTTPSGKHGFIVVTTPQGVTAQAKILDNVSLDPAVPESDTTVTNAFSPLLVRIDPFAFAPVNGAAPVTSETRFALSNPGTATATVELVPYNASGSPATSQPFVVTLAPNGQFFSDDLVTDMGLAPVFFGWVTIQSNQPVMVYNHRRSGQGGTTVPVH